MTSSFGQQLRLHRFAAGKTLQQVADACGCTKAYLSQVERTDNCGRISADRLYAIAQFLGVPMAALMGESPDESASVEDLDFFQHYVVLAEPDKIRLRKVCRLINQDRAFVCPPP
jgi:transcriptional regulator with XRE-family HTH domain